MNKLIYFLFLLGVFLSPFTTFLPLGVNVSSFDLLLMTCFGLIIISKSIIFDGNIRFNYTKEYVLLYLFVIGSAFSLFNSASLITSVLILLQYLFAILVQKTIISHTFLYAKDVNKTLFKILDMYLFSLAIVLVIGFLAFLGLLPNSSSFFAGNGRLYSVKGNPNSLAKFLVYSLPILLLYIDIKRKSIFSYSLIALSIFCLFLTASFGGMIYATATVIYYYLIKMILVTKPIQFKNRNILIKKNLLNFRTVLLVSFAFSTISYFLMNPPEIFSKRVLAADDLSDAGSASMKIELMLESINLIFTEYGLVGMGLGSYPFVSHFLTNVHNLYLLIFVESGILGFIGLIGLLLYIFFNSLKLIKKVETNIKYILLALNSSVFGILISMTTNPHTYSRSVWLLIILLWGYTETIKKKKLFH